MCMSAAKDAVRAEAILHLSRIHKVRWLSRASTMHKMCESFEPLLVFLKEHNANVEQAKKTFSLLSDAHYYPIIFIALRPRGT